MASIKPTFSDDQDMGDVSPADVAEAKKRTKAQAAYDAADQTPPSKSSDARALVRGQRGYAKGGAIRGGGIEVRGKTKGKMIAMCGGGMTKGKK
jgi:hypothetical protein